MPKLKCLGIACSPRVNGNTSILLTKALEGAAASGAQCETLALREYNFSACTACEGCHRHGQCVLKDDMQMIYEKLLGADRIILAAPIFAMGINAQAKMLIDRGQRFWATKYILDKPVIENKDRPDRRGIFISAAGTDLPGVFDCAIRTVKYYFKMLEVKYVEHYCYSSVDTRGEISAHEAALEQVYAAGRELVGTAN